MAQLDTVVLQVWPRRRERALQRDARGKATHKADAEQARW